MILFNVSHISCITFLKSMINFLDIVGHFWSVVANGTIVSR